MGQEELWVPILRRSWESFILWIVCPAQIKRRALKKAWTTKWKKTNEINVVLKALNITPSWLNVDRATIFFMSHSTIALSLASNMVITPKDERRGRK